ncbi:MULTISPECIES: glycoside hydrolase family 130 protein [unclassified Paraflavitalea]|uniref:glycoside hydrolase family 130 protein n=1 Tax=unclassified Paraflavitalea TaxID=2798305 RepID=UPI003D324FBF
MNKYLLPISLFVLFSCKEPQEKTPGIAAEQNSSFLIPFEKADTLNPVLEKGNGSFVCPILNKSIPWENKDVFNPAAIVRNDTLFLLYRAEDTIGKFAGTSRIGIAWSLDGEHFTKHKEPVLYPQKDQNYRWEWEGGCEDPRIIETEDGSYIMTYTAYDGKLARLLVAKSKDLYHWEKFGSVFNDSSNKKYIDHWSKSGAIIGKMNQGKIIATKINDRYWMYWGDTDIFLASSDDLIHWSPVEKDGKLLTVFGPRKGKFDSDLVEPGPPAMITDKGILLIYNCRNVPSKGDSSLVEGTYAPSQILLDPKDPTKVLSRMDTYFMKPEKPYEVNGQVNRVCFAEGLVYYKNAWRLFYGTADSKIAMAVKK